jgi:hypothetical protein
MTKSWAGGLINHAAYAGNKVMKYRKYRQPAGKIMKE